MMISSKRFSLILFLVQVIVSKSSTARSATPPRGAYIHIPFCRRRCYYCDFPIKVVGNGYKTDSFEPYVDLIHKEISYSVLNTNNISPLETIYFGGGTPSLLPPHHIQSILRTIQMNIGILPECEITIEIDPGTFDKSTLSSWLDIGINRFSLGIQSFDDWILEKAGRSHRRVDIDSSLQILRAVNSDINFSIDLISGLPYLSMDTWRSTLELASRSGASHISIYDLQIEEKTAFGRWYKDRIGEYPLPSEDDAILMYETAVEILQSKNFEHYEISNYAVPGRRSRHNQLYWTCSPTWGFGMSAASYTNGIRMSRPKTMDAYRAWIDHLVDVGYEALNEECLEGLNIEDAMIDKIQERIMLALRTSDGLDLTRLDMESGFNVSEKILKGCAPYLTDGSALHSIGHGDGLSVLRLCDPKGFLISNEIISSIFVSLTG